VEIRLRGEWGLGVGLELEMGRLAANFFFNGGLGCSELNLVKEKVRKTKQLMDFC
jgi:hypothetical protein